MGTGDERHRGPGSPAVPAVTRLRALEGDGMRVDTLQPQVDRGARELPPPPPPPHRPESSGPPCPPRNLGPGPPATGAGQPEGSSQARPSALRERDFPALGASPAGPAPRARSPPPVTSAPGRPGPPRGPSPSRPRAPSWRESIKAGDRATRGHLV
ncbi:proline-rich protein HaeIII subfamily 1-like [Nycticebus coucang]|uniref:proline-rich protein HaeIII subfamily 1-like n=1 Tax=Nycticebus coucang TaxID=9470 RepID=UPI00234DD310|nr:proline-rich protein HaeIII subfamily 1-like [Nycticebus coucang]